MLFHYFRSICLYPNGDEQKSYIALYLMVLEKGSSKWKVNYNLGIIGSKQNYPVYTIHADEIDGGHGHSKAMSHAEFFDPVTGCFKDGKFTIFCKVIQFIKLLRNLIKHLG
jgi:hypothetical protein